MILKDFKKIISYAKKINKEVLKIEKWKESEYRPVYNIDVKTLYWVTYMDYSMTLTDIAIFN